MRKVRDLEGTGAGATNAVRFTVDGNYCITAGDDRTVRLWNPHKDAPNDAGRALLIKSYGGVHGYPILDVAVAADNARFVSAGVDKTLFVHDVVSGRLVRRIIGHTQKINAVALNKEASVVLSASYDQSVRIWDLRSNARDPIQTLNDFKDSVTSVTLTGDAGKIVAASIDGRLRTFDLRRGQVSVDCFCADESLVCVRLTHDSRCALSMCFTPPSNAGAAAAAAAAAAASFGVAASSTAGAGTGVGSGPPATLRLSDLGSGRQLRSFEGHQQASYKSECGVCADDCTVVAGSEDGSLCRWDVLGPNVDGGGEGMRRTPAHARAVSSLSCHPSLPLVLSASYDGSVRLWDLLPSPPPPPP